jgi:hypothetical protein
MWEAIASAVSMPSIGGTTTVIVCNSNHWAIGAYVYIDGLGFMQIIGRVGVTGLAMVNTGVLVNSSPGTVAPEGSIMFQVGPPNPYKIVSPVTQNVQVLSGQEEAIDMTSGNDDEELTTVTYQVPFGAAVNPIVVLTVDVDSDLANLFSVYVRDADYLGFKIYGCNDFPVDRTVNINWIAIG